MRKLLYILLFFFTVNFYGQVSNFQEKFLLPNDVSETSGLIFFNNKIITHNDSGGNASLHEIDSLSGMIVRTINISNATNVDWEDITQDDNHIYIADIGNNSGNRQDLKIYKVLKSDYLSSSSVSAEIISFSYEDQSNFSSQPNNSNFDAEAITFYQGNLLIFTKNWVDFETNVYSIPASSGSHSAQKISSYNTNGLITGASYNSGDDSFLMTGYSTELSPFLIYISHNRPTGLDIFGNDATKLDLTGILEQGSQVEGITFFDGAKYYISREFFSITISTILFEFPQKLYQFSNDLFNLLSVNDDELSKSIQVVPNPIDHTFNIIRNGTAQKIKTVSVFSFNGIKVFSKKEIQSINIKELAAGVYFVKIEFEAGKIVVKKIIKK